MEQSFDMASLSGVVPILPTPLTAEGELDCDALRALVDFCALHEMDGVVVIGSNGEFPYLRFEEKVRVMQAAVEGAAGRLPVIGTASACGTREAVDLAKSAHAAGCAAVMAALPLYFSLSMDEVHRHFERLAREGGLPVFFYHFPQVTGLRLRPDDLARIAAVDGVVGAKVTVVSRSCLRATVEATQSEGWRIFTGTSFLLHECLAYGGAGVFCPLPLMAPTAVREVESAFRGGQHARSKSLQRRLRQAVPLFSGMPGPAWLQAWGFSVLAALSRGGSKERIGPPQGLLKEALRLYGHHLQSTVREPFDPVPETRRRVLRETLQGLGWRKEDQR